MLTKYEVAEVEAAISGQVPHASGGSGSVYRALLRGSPVAIKRMTDLPVAATAVETAVAREVEVLGRVPRHPNIVRLRGYASRASTVASRAPALYLVYDMYEQGDLAEHLTLPEPVAEGDQGLFEWERVKVLLDVCEGLRFCHGGCDGAFDGVILHRDVKPENIMLRRDVGSGEVVAALGDFGISKVYQSGEATATSSLLGTPGYIAPEVSSGGHVSAASDVYSLGVVILQVASGLPVRVPHPGPPSTTTTHIREHLRRASEAHTLSSTATVSWRTRGALGELVAVGLGCCCDVDEGPRLTLDEVRVRLARVLERVPPPAFQGPQGAGTPRAALPSSSTGNSSARRRAGGGGGSGTSGGSGGSGARSGASPATASPTTASRASSTALAPQAPPPTGATAGVLEDRECVVCLDAPRTIRFVPCQHCVCCGDCARRVLGSEGAARTCPVCTVEVVRAVPAARGEPTFVPGR